MDIRYFNYFQCTSKTMQRLSKLEGQGYVHSLFEHAINITSPSGSLVTIVDESVGNGPNCLRLDDFLLFKSHVKKEDQVIFQKSSLVIGDSIFPYIGAEIVSCDLEISNLSHEVLIHRVKAIQGSSWYQERKATLEQQLFVQAVYQKFTELRSMDIMSLTHDERKGALSRLIGLGIGLTPSGDDFLTGLAYVVTLRSDDLDDLITALRGLQSQVKISTNIVSYQQYEMALVGEVRCEVSKCVSAILSNQPLIEVEEDIQTILQIGSSSGFDMLQGILFGLEIS